MLHEIQMNEKEMQTELEIFTVQVRNKIRTGYLTGNCLQKTMVTKSPPGEHVCFAEDLKR